MANLRELPETCKGLPFSKKVGESINCDDLEWDSRGIKLDSFKLRLPLEKVKVIDENIRGKWLLVHEESAVVDPNARTRENSVYRDFPGKVNIKFGIEKQVIKSKIQEFLTMNVPAKILGANYLDGINYENVKEVYQALLGANVAEFSFNDFIDTSACTDVDFAKDFKYQGDFKELLQNIAQVAKPSKKRDHGYRIFTEKHNQGIEFSVRETTSIASNPYFKIYNKGVELMSKSRDFTRDFLYNQNIVGLGRMEATLKNKKHVDMLWGHKCNSLKAMVTMPQNDKARLLGHAIKCHLEPGQKEKKSWAQLKGMNLALYQSIKIHLEKGAVWEELRERLIYCYANRSQKSQIRKKLDELYSIYQSGKESLLVPLFEPFTIN